MKKTPGWKVSIFLRNDSNLFNRPAELFPNMYIEFWENFFLDCLFPRFTLGKDDEVVNEIFGSSTPSCSQLSHDVLKKDSESVQSADFDSVSDDIQFDWAPHDKTGT